MFFFACKVSQPGAWCTNFALRAQSDTDSPRTYANEEEIRRLSVLYLHTHFGDSRDYCICRSLAAMVDGAEARAVEAWLPDGYEYGVASARMRNRGVWLAGQHTCTSRLRSRRETSRSQNTPVVIARM